MFTEADEKLINFYLVQPNHEATATQVMETLGYASIGAVNLHVVRLAKNLAETLRYTPETRENGQDKWWPCLFEGRYEGQHFVWKLRPEIEALFATHHSKANFQNEVEASLKDSARRAERLAKAPKEPEYRVVKSVEYVRNPDVVAEALAQAKGHCQSCGAPAPFKRKSDGTPYLEVHHKAPLAAGGDDSVENAIALCPNCHRQAHYG